MFDFDALINRKDSECAKWHAYEDDLLPMWVADMEFRSPEPVIEALKCRVDHGVFGYAMPPEGLKESVINWLQNRYDWAVSPEELVFVPGVVSGFNLAAHAVSRPGDGVVVQTPTYGPFFGVPKNVDLIQQEMELTRDQDGQYSIDYDAFENCMTGRSRIFMLCNPQNPTGRVFRLDELEKMAEICLKNNVIICSDEIHCDLVFSGNKHIPIASISPEVAANTITLIAPSKTFNIAGLKTSVAIIKDEKLRKEFDGSRKGLLGSVNLLGSYATLAAYEHGAPWLDALLVYLENNRNFLSKFIAEELPGVNMAVPEGTFLAWLDCREVGIDRKPSEFFKEKSKVLMNDGEWFGQGGEGFVRLNFGCPRAMLVEALEKLKEALVTQ